MRKRTSKVWLSINDEDFIKLVKNSVTLKEVLNYFGFENKGSNYKTCRERIKHLNIDTSHFLSNTDISNESRKVIKEDFLKDLIYPSRRTRSSIKKYLVKFDLLEYKCAECGIKEKWNGKKISLQLDYINGINNDNRLENLRFLCPNCHSQTPNFAGKSLKKQYSCKQCGGNKKTKESKLCVKCRGKFLHPEKDCWPPQDEMKKLIWEKPMSHIAQDLGVSDKSVAKFCKRHNIEKPSRGYFLKSKQEKQ